MLRLTPRQSEVASWPCPEGMHPLLHRLLSLRGVGSREEARAFLHPGRENLRDPYLLSDMQAAVDIIRDAVKKDQRICVYGDYDVDGVCASAILTLYLKELGARCGVYLPSRHTEGYGLNADAVDFISLNYELLITVDCGITAFELVERALSKGMRVIVTDHHKPGERLPGCPTVNPLLGGYPFGYLCGTGVAFQLVTALAGRDKAMEYIDLAALATIADIVPLRDENRAIACLGLKKINVSARPGIRALICVSGLEGKVLSEGNVAFQLTPRLNASGRLGDAKRAYDLLTSTDAETCERLAQELDQENRNRKDFENRAIEEAEQQLVGFDFASNPVIIVKGRDWNPGVIGLTASRLTEKYHCPAIALTPDGEYYTGSCRSIEGVDIHEALKSVSHLLDRFGGHKMAAGLRLRAENLDEFTRALNRTMLDTLDPRLWIPFQEYDAEVSGSELTPELAKDIEALSPTGCGNPDAVFLTRCEISEAYPVGKEKEHLKLGVTTNDGTHLGGIWFRHGADAALLRGKADMLYALGLNTYMGQTSMQAMVKQLLPRSDKFDPEGDEMHFGGMLLSLCENFGRFQAQKPITPGEVSQYFSSDFRGSLVVASDAQSARAAANVLGEEADICLYRYPGDPRGFNALCLCPEGQAPGCYKNVFYAGVPAFLCAGGRRILGVPVSPAFSKLPDVEGLREIYRQVRNAAQARRRYTSLSEALSALSRAAKMEASRLSVGLAVLTHAELCGIKISDGGCVPVYFNEKRDPLEDELYREFRRIGG